MSCEFNSHMNPSEPISQLIIREIFQEAENLGVNKMT